MAFNTIEYLDKIQDNFELKNKRLKPQEFITPIERLETQIEEFEIFSKNLNIIFEDIQMRLRRLNSMLEKEKTRQNKKNK